MLKQTSPYRQMLVLILVFWFCFSGRLFSQTEIIDFKSDQWVLKNAEMVQFEDQECLIGYAYLKDVEFENGVIEVDLQVTGSRSYPGIVFRMQSEENYENIYIRPHRAGLYPDAIQYTPVINGIAGWQLYHGDGFTNSARFPANQWMHLKIEIDGTQARLFIDDLVQPALVIHHLQHGKSKGTIGVSGPRDKSAFFANFKYSTDHTPQFEPAPLIETPPGIFQEWYLSPAFKLSQIDIERYPTETELSAIQWQAVTSAPSGLVDVAHFVKRTGREPDCVWAKTNIYADTPGVKKINFGYSDAVSIFLNGQILFFGNSAYQHRDRSFLGIVGFNDALYLPLKKGENELLFMLAESFGGWGFMCQDGMAVFEHQSVKKVWETTADLLIPESIVYDPKRDRLYISNYDAYQRSTPEEKQFISKVTPAGEIEELKWVTGLNQPTGLTIFKDNLYVVERSNLVQIDLKTGHIQKRFPIPQARFVNDIVADKSGNLYISDSRTNVIYRFHNGQCEEWCTSAEIQQPNGLQLVDNALVVGNNGDKCLKAINLSTKAIKTMVQLGAGIIDGIQSDNQGNLLVSHWEGRLYQITPAGQITKILDTTVPGRNSADFEYIKSKNLIIIPTFGDNRVVAYQLTE